MEDDTGRAEGDLDVLVGALNPVEDLLDVVLLDAEVVAVADSTLKQHTNRVREFCWRQDKLTKEILTDSGVVQARELVVVKILTGVRDGRFNLGVERVWLRGRSKGTERGCCEGLVRTDASDGVKDTLHDLKFMGIRLQRN